MPLVNAFIDDYVDRSIQGTSYERVDVRYPLVGPGGGLWPRENSGRILTQPCSRLLFRLHVRVYIVDLPSARAQSIPQNSYHAACQFLERNNLLSVIRAHEAQDAG